MEITYQLTMQKWMALRWDRFLHDVPLWPHLQKWKWLIALIVAIAYSLGVGVSVLRVNEEVSRIVSIIVTFSIQIPIVTAFPLLHPKAYLGSSLSTTV